MNYVCISGNLTADVETRYLTSGSAVGNFNVAVNRKWKDQSGELKEEVSFLGCVTFGKQAETIAQHLKKGSKVLLTGRLKQESWDDKDTGKKRSKTVIVVESFEFMGSKSDGSTTPAPKRERPEASDVPAGAKVTPTKPEDDDVPF